MSADTATVAVAALVDSVTVVLDAANVSVTSAIDDEVVVVETGVQGPPGAAGTDAYFVFDQGVPSTTWTVTHNLGKKPSVSVEDSAHNLVEGDVDYTDNDSLTISFGLPFSGSAFLN